MAEQQIEVALVQCLSCKPCMASRIQPPAVPQATSSSDAPREAHTSKQANKQTNNNTHSAPTRSHVEKEQAHECRRVPSHCRIMCLHVQCTCHCRSRKARQGAVHVWVVWVHTWEDRMRARVRVLCMRRPTSPLQFASRIADAVRACKMRGNASPALSSIVCCDVAQCSAAWSSVVGRIALRALSAICRRHIDAIRRGPFKPVPT
jgi:hypothetical protein